MILGELRSMLYFKEKVIQRFSSNKISNYLTIQAIVLKLLIFRFVITTESELLTERLSIEILSDILSVSSWVEENEFLLSLPSLSVYISHDFATTFFLKNRVFFFLKRSWNLFNSKVNNDNKIRRFTFCWDYLPK